MIITEENFIFVFGSNLAGRHGKGAAKFAADHYGAVYGVGEGITGRSYAIPTKDENLKTRSLDEISQSIKTFCDYAKTNDSLVFLLTPVGCGLAGYRKKDIWRIFMWGLPQNVLLTSTWVTE